MKLAVLSLVSLVSFGSSLALAGTHSGFTCSAIASSSAPRTVPQAAVGSGATLSQAREAALHNCRLVNSGPAVGCEVVRCARN